jgi:ribosomal protein S18 acetylase RimI-like enzyme
MLAVTLDTSCALNFLGHDPEVDDALVDLVAAAMVGRLNLCVSEQAFEEVARTPTQAAREQRLARMRAFGRAELPAHLHAQRRELVERLHASIFPDSQPGSRTDEHNSRDCLQLATHSLLGRDVFCTRDRALLKRSEQAAHHSIAVLDPAAVLKRLEGSVTIRVGVLGERIGAVALSTRKDERVVKLSAFYVTEDARDAGLGQHLLWSELRTWATGKVEKVYVTVSSRHAELIGFFRAFGFVIEGVSPRRYQEDTAELVLAKHIIRRLLREDDLDAFAAQVPAHVFSVPGTVGAEQETWALAPANPHPSFEWSGEAGSLQLLATAHGAPERRWGLLELERIFHPLRFCLAGRTALLVPIQPRWADAMLEHTHRQPSLFAPALEKLILRADNAYYCYPRLIGTASPGTPIVFYVSGGTGLVGEARIVDAAVGVPEELFARFGGLGVYGIGEIRGHVGKSGAHLGESLALRFGSYVPFPVPVDIAKMREALGRNVQPQALTSITSEEFENLRRTGGLGW